VTYDYYGTGGNASATAIATAAGVTVVVHDQEANAGDVSVVARASNSLSSGALASTLTTVGQDGAPASFTLSGSGAHSAISAGTYSGTVTVNASSSYLISGGTLTTSAVLNHGTFSQSGGTASVGNLDNDARGLGATTVSGGTFTANRVRQNSLSVSTTGLAKINTAATIGSSEGTSRVGALTISTATGTKLDLTNNNLIVDYSGTSPMGGLGTRGTIAGDIKSGYNSGAWTGDGLVTSSGNSSNYALGFAEASSIFGSFPATFSGQTVDNTSVLVRFTRYGDANLSGNVNSDDLNILFTHYGTSGKLWHQGDFNYDGSVNSDDYNLLAGNFGLVASFPAGPTPGDWALLASAVPEPSTTLVMTFLGAVLLSRRAGNKERRVH
jgi:hypothetical protein